MNPVRQPRKGRVPVGRVPGHLQRAGHAAPDGAGAVQAEHPQSLAARNWDDNGELGWLTGPNNRNSKGGRKWRQLM